MKKKIKRSDFDLVVYDFDGVMTDNRAVLLEDGTEGVFVNRSDGLAVGMFRKSSIRQLILSMEKNPVVLARAKKLKIPALHGVEDKKSVLSSFLKKSRIESHRVVYIGNDINDEAVMKTVGIPCCPSDAYPQIKRISKIRLRTAGGYGVVRELFDLIDFSN